MKKKIKVPSNWEDRPDAFERFEKLTRGLIAVPKSEIDKSQAQHAKSRKTAKKARSCNKLKHSVALLSLKREAS